MYKTTLFEIKHLTFVPTNKVHTNDGGRAYQIE